MTYVILKDRGTVQIDEIATAADGLAIEDELDAAILSIDAQLACKPRTSENRQWWDRADHARRHLRLARPKLQRKISELRKAENTAAEVGRIFDKRRAFIDAAKDLLPADKFEAIWDRAQAIRPEAFIDIASNT